MYQRYIALDVNVKSHQPLIISVYLYNEQPPPLISSTPVENEPLQKEPTKYNRLTENNINEYTAEGYNILHLKVLDITNYALYDNTGLQRLTGNFQISVDDIKSVNEIIDSIISEGKNDFTVNDLTTNGKTALSIVISNIRGYSSNGDNMSETSIQLLLELVKALVSNNADVNIQPNSPLKIAKLIIDERLKSRVLEILSQTSSKGGRSKKSRRQRVHRSKSKSKTRYNRKLSKRRK